MLLRVRITQGIRAEPRNQFEQHKNDKETMPPIETIARPVRNRISVSIPKEYRSYSFRVVLVPIVPEPRKFRTIEKIPGLFAKISDEDLFSNDSSLWEACSE